MERLTGRRAGAPAVSPARSVLAEAVERLKVAKAEMARLDATMPDRFGLEGNAARAVEEAKAAVETAARELAEARVREARGGPPADRAAVLAAREREVEAKDRLVAARAAKALMERDHAAGDAELRQREAAVTAAILAVVQDEAADAVRELAVLEERVAAGKETLRQILGLARPGLDPVPLSWKEVAQGVIGDARTQEHHARATFGTGGLPPTWRPRSTTSPDISAWTDALARLREDATTPLPRSLVPLP
ncbi:hypothetical protein ACE7GA_01470 [Roseomonas sp. CCTCC AB2023176]|uniref:hypothetical protein n=1 Tax=Roseomonas sp. CCTCC AB2023176 TaxID=3342640 RepID=UPI0035E35FE0